MIDMIDIHAYSSICIPKLSHLRCGPRSLLIQDLVTHLFGLNEHWIHTLGCMLQWIPRIKMQLQMKFWNKYRSSGDVCNFKSQLKLSFWRPRIFATYSMGSALDWCERYLAHWSPGRSARSLLAADCRIWTWNLPCFESHRTPTCMLVCWLRICFR